MRKILIQTTTDRGTETRISTRRNTMKLTVFFADDSGEIREDELIFSVTPGGSLQVSTNAPQNALLLQTEGEPAEKLHYK